MIITVIGEDERQKNLSVLLNLHYDTIYICGKEKFKTVKNIIKLSDVIILPLPLTRDGKTINTTEFIIEDFFKYINPNAKIFGGMCETIKSKYNNISDYNLDEEFTLKNAFYTAESAVALSILNINFSLSEAKILILGNGRIGKYLAKMLSSFCKDITVSARKREDFDYIASQGFNYIHSNNINNLSSYNIIFNTIPQKIIGENAIETLNKDSLIIDLASKNSELIRAEKYIDAKALPAKYCSKSSAKALYDSVIKQL